MNRALLIGGFGAAVALGWLQFSDRPSPSAPPAVATDPPGRAAIESARPLFFDLRYGEDAGFVLIANTQARAGDVAGAAGTIEDGLKKHPGSALLWTELGNMRSLEAGALTPAAEAAFARSRALDPANLAPDYFRARAQLRSSHQHAQGYSELIALERKAPPGPIAERIAADLRAYRGDPEPSGLATP